MHVIFLNLKATFTKYDGTTEFYDRGWLEYIGGKEPSFIWETKFLHQGGTLTFQKGCLENITQNGIWDGYLYFAYGQIKFGFMPVNSKFL